MKNHAAKCDCDDCSAGRAYDSAMKKGDAEGDSKDWIKGAIGKPGALRGKLGAKPGKDIPAGKLAKTEKAGGTLGKEARLAATLRSFKK